MKMKKSKNLLWCFVSWLQVLLLALPLLNVGYRVLDYSVNAWHRQEVQGEVAVNQPVFAKELNNAIVYAYFDFNLHSVNNSYITYAFDSANQYWNCDYIINEGIYLFDDFYTVEGYALQNYNLTNFDFIGLVTNAYNLLDVEPSIDLPYGSWVLPMFFNWYMNYILSILIAFFIPYILIYLFAWFSGFAETFLHKTKGVD